MNFTICMICMKGNLTKKRKLSKSISNKPASLVVVTEMT